MENGSSLSSSHFNCVHCGIKFPKRTSLFRHIRLNHSPSENQGTNCQKSASPLKTNENHVTKQPVNKHRKSKCPPKPKYKICLICVQSPNPPDKIPKFTTNRQLEMHKFVDHSEQHFLPYFSSNYSESQAQFKSICDRFLHAEVYLSLRCLKCLYCPIKLRPSYNRGSFRMHLLSVHLKDLVQKLKKQQNRLTEGKKEELFERSTKPERSPSPSKLTCQHCGILFTQQTSRACHMVIHQPPGSQQKYLVKDAIRCPDCGKMIKKKFLKRHQQTTCRKMLYYNINKPTSLDIVPSTTITDKFNNKPTEHANQIPLEKVVMKVNMPEIIDLVDDDSISDGGDGNYEMILPH